MTTLSKKFEQIVKKELSSTVLPVKTDDGILLGDVLIVSQGSLKTVIKKDIVKYKDIHLNSVAIKIAKILVSRNTSIQADELYKLDQEYGKWLNDSLLLKAQYEKAKSKNDNDRADVFWARYIESRDKTLSYKSRVDTLAR